MAITASKLRENIYRLLDEALATGEAIEIVRRGRRLRIVPETSHGKLANLKKHPDWFVGDVEDVIGMDWLKFWNAEVIFLDTHVLIWLAMGQPERLSVTARRALEGDSNPLASPMALLELELLHEIGRLKPSAGTVVAELAAGVGLQVDGLSFRAIGDRALSEGWTRDPFDRVIVAHARAANAGLITKDVQILRHFPRALW